MSNCNNVHIVSLTRESRLTWYGQLVYSWLRYCDSPCSIRFLAKYLHIRWQHAKSAVEDLATYNLVRQDDFGVVAVEPGELTSHWFHWREDRQLPWQKRSKYTVVPLSSDQTTKQSYLAATKDRLPGKNNKYIAKVTGLSYSTVRRSMPTTPTPDQDMPFNLAEIRRIWEKKHTDRTAEDEAKIDAYYSWVADRAKSELGGELPWIQETTVHLAVAVEKKVSYLIELGMSKAKAAYMLNIVRRLKRNDESLFNFLALGSFEDLVEGSIRENEKNKKMKGKKTGDWSNLLKWKLENTR